MHVFWSIVHMLGWIECMSQFFKSTSASFDSMRFHELNAENGFLISKKCSRSTLIPNLQRSASTVFSVDGHSPKTCPISSGFHPFSAILLATTPTTTEIRSILIRTYRDYFIIMWMLYALQLSIIQAKKNEHFMLRALSGIRNSRKPWTELANASTSHILHISNANCKEWNIVFVTICGPRDS